MHRIVHAIARRGDRIYPSSSQVEYKLKWRPGLVQPEYLGFQGGLSVGVAWRILRLKKAVGFA
jgi:lysylphosphatidylglycerol synthetase-like protein (DUF2156 family)